MEVTRILTKAGNRNGALSRTAWLRTFVNLDSWI